MYARDLYFGYDEAPPSSKSMESQGKERERTHTARKEEPLSVKGNDKTPSYIASSALNRNASFADMMSAMSKRRKNKVNSCNIHSNQCIEFDVKVLTVVFAIIGMCVSFQPRNRQFCTIAETLNYILIQVISDQ